MKPDSCLSLQAIAQRLGVSIKTVRRLIKDGELPAVKIRSRVVVRESDLAAYISSL
jgi:excisionase family DNA binding protein